MDLPEPNSVSLSQLFDASGDGVMITTPFREGEVQAQILYANPQLCIQSGYPLYELLGQSPEKLWGEENQLKERHKIELSWKRHHPVRLTIQLTRKNGTHYWVDASLFPVFHDNGPPLYHVAITRDITQRKKRESRLYHLATTDSLTQIANRHHFLELCEIEHENYKRYKTPFCMVMFDLDRFKDLNDQFSHEAGDLMLISLCKKVRELLRETDLFGRIGGEEFAILLPNTSLCRAQPLIERLHKAIAGLIVPYKAQSLTITASFGLTQVSRCDIHLQQLLHRADTLLYKAKLSGRNRICCSALSSQ